MNKFSAEFVLHVMIAGCIAGCAVMGGVGWYALQQANDSAVAAARTSRDIGVAAGLARGADAAARAQAAEFQQWVARADAGAAEQQAAQLRRQQETIGKQLEQARQLLASRQLDTSAVTQAVQLQERIVQEYAQRLQLAGGSSAPTVAWTDVAPAVDKLALQDAARAEADAAAAALTTAWTFIALILVGVAMNWFFRYWIRHANVGPLRTALHLVQRVAAGDLTVTAEGMDQAHTRRLAEAMNGMTASLRELATEVVESARTVAETSAQIAQGNVDLSQRTEEQATTLEETASSMEELTSTVAQNADNARQASQLAVAASDVARKGGHAVGQVVSTMNDISGSSRRIGDIIGVIDGIAFQTNILALNAAVEAARAGDQGRGFAVVAAEVRTLAQRSAAAAKEIKGLIGDSLGKVENGTKQVDAAGKTMEEIVTAVKKVSDLIAEIAAASQEQSSGIGQINTAVAQMEQVVQQNASLVEEASAATESMKDQAAALLNAVSRFRLSDESPMPSLPRQGMARRSPAPIKVRPSGALPPAYQAAIAGAPAQPRAQAGQWEEF